MATVAAPASEPDEDAAVEGGFQVRRNAIRGFAVGTAVATLVFVRFALLPGTTRPTGLYVGLAVVLGVSVGLLATIVLVGWRVRRLSKR